ncbi:nuclease homologue [Celeribacter baekdonensis]|uniref:Nuclease homologue n=1 Tax=Celeribacter baekdonensis TaxID=875171 RepID=A0A1G7GD63_9RHOB|nr:thermonuclease family protein [Celeribacter baekdonensis]SDE86023.1 nuclease homologue [Celeribacter baekdonensis]
MAELLFIIALIAGAAFMRHAKKEVRRAARHALKPSTPPNRSKPVSPANAFNEKASREALEKPVLRGSAYVVDGDTIVIQKTQIRLFGVDAPEMNHPYGKKAKWALVRLCKGQSIRAEVTDVDSHGRTVARCYLPDGRDLSAEMVKQGLAIDWPKFSGGLYQSMEVPDIRKKLWLADARQKGRMHVWKQFEVKQDERQGGG